MRNCLTWHVAIQETGINDSKTISSKKKAALACERELKSITTTKSEEPCCCEAAVGFDEKKPQLVASSLTSVSQSAA